MKYIPSLITAGALLLGTVVPAFGIWFPPMPTATPVRVLNNYASIQIKDISKATTGFNTITGAGTNSIYTGQAQASSTTTVNNVNLTNSFSGNINNTFEGSLLGVSKATTGFNSIMAPVMSPINTMSYTHHNTPTPTCNTCNVNLISTGTALSGTETLITGVNVLGFGN